MDFGNLPLYYLAKLDASYYADARPATCANGACRWKKYGSETARKGSAVTLSHTLSDIATHIPLPIGPYPVSNDCLRECLEC